MLALDRYHRLMQLFADKVIGKKCPCYWTSNSSRSIRYIQQMIWKLLLLCIRIWNMFMFFTLLGDQTTCVKHAMMHYSDSDYSSYDLTVFRTEPKPLESKIWGKHTATYCVQILLFLNWHIRSPVYPFQRKSITRVFNVDFLLVWKWFDGY